MKRILFISQYLNRNGTEAFMMSVFRNLDPERFQADFLLYTQQESDYTREVEARGCRIYRVCSRRESLTGWHRALNAFFKGHAQEYAAVHFCGNSLTTIAPLYYAWRYGVPVRIAHAHNSSARGGHNRLLHLLKRGFARCICTHHFACSEKAAQWFFGRHEAVIVRNGIDVRTFAYNEEVRHDVRSQLGIKEETKIWGHVGRFVTEKNHRFLIEVFAAYHERNVDSCLMLVGEGDQLEASRSLAKELGIQDAVYFMGLRADVNRLMQAMDCFVMPSFFEGLPYVLVEAQCAGLPCIISDVISRDIRLTDLVTYQSLKQSAAQWAETVEGVLYHYLRRDGAEKIRRAGYSVQDTVEYLEEVYDSNVGKK